MSPLAPVVKGFPSTAQSFACVINFNQHFCIPGRGSLSTHPWHDDDTRPLSCCVQGPHKIPLEIETGVTEKPAVPAKAHMKFQEQGRGLQAWRYRQHCQPSTQWLKQHCCCRILVELQQHCRLRCAYLRAGLRQPAIPVHKALQGPQLKGQSFIKPSICRLATAGCGQLRLQVQELATFQKC